MDVKATIAVAKQIKKANPQLYSYYFETRTKEQIIGKLKKDTYKVFLLTQYFYNDYWNVCTHPMMPLFYDNPDKPRTLYCYDLLLGIPESIEKAHAKNAFVKVSLNKYPFIAPLNVLPENSVDTLGFDKQHCLSLVDAIRSSGVLDSKEQIRELTDSYLSSIDNSNLPPGVFKFRDFVPPQVYKKLSSFKIGLKQKKKTSAPVFPEAPYYRDSIICYVANNYPDLLSDDDRIRFEQIERIFILGSNNTSALSLKSFYDSINNLLSDDENTTATRIILNELSKYAEEKAAQYNCFLE